MKKMEKVIKAAEVAPQTASLRTRLFRGYVLAAIFGLLIMSLAAHTIPYFSWDVTLAKLIQSFSFLQNLMIAISWPGYAPQWAILVVGLILTLAAVKLYWEATASAIGFSVTEIIVNLLKHFVGRTRPLDTLVSVYTPLSGGSFPSGHVVDYVVVFGFIGFLLFSLLKRSLWIRHVTLIVLIGMIVMIGPSRVFLGEHWPSDALGAYLLGTILLWATVEFYAWGKHRHFFKSGI